MTESVNAAASASSLHTLHRVLPLTQQQRVGVARRVNTDANRSDSRAPRRCGGARSDAAARLARAVEVSTLPGALQRQPQHRLGLTCVIMHVLYSANAPAHTSWRLSPALVEQARLFACSCAHGCSGALSASLRRFLQYSLSRAADSSAGVSLVGGAAGAAAAAAAGIARGGYLLD